MTKGTILTKNIRFPKESLPEGFDNENLYPQWMEELEIEYDDSVLVDEKGKYTIRRLHGPAAGDAQTPVFMDLEGQPQPITGFSSSLLEEIDTGLEINERLEDLAQKMKESQITLSENSPFLNLVKTQEEDEHFNYEIQESLSEFLARNNSEISIWNNLIVHNQEAVSELVSPEQDVENIEEKTVSPIYTYSGTALDFYNEGQKTFVLDSNVLYDELEVVAIVSRIDTDNSVLDTHSFHVGDSVVGMGDGYHPNALVPEEGGTWGFSDESSGLEAAVETPAFELNESGTLVSNLFKGLHWVNVHNDDDLITVSIRYSENNKVNYRTIQHQEAVYRETLPQTVSLSIGQGLLSGGRNQLVLGQYNREVTSPLVIGNGEDAQNRNNLFEVAANGDVLISSKIKDADGVTHGTVFVGTDAPGEDSNFLVWITP